VAAAPAALGPELRRRVLREAGLVLGYLHFDGEGVGQDKAKSCVLFKVAADAGCAEAAQVRGWMFNTGQYE
jgi:TPR repeat protein